MHSNPSLLHHMCEVSDVVLDLDRDLCHRIDVVLVQY